MNKLAQYIKKWRESKGFHTPDSIVGQGGQEMLGKLMLVTTEVAEAAEAVRYEDQENFEEELVDTMIRILDICATVGIDIEQAIDDKMGINEQREYLHGKKSDL